jgi:hypothetical protein
MCGAGMSSAPLSCSGVVWGFVGPRHARFSDFVRSPIVAWVNLRDLLYGRACRNVGHSPGRRNDHCPPGLPGRDGDDGTHGLREVGLGGGLEFVRVIGVCTTRRWRNPSYRAILCVVPAMIVVWQNLRKKRWWWIR